MDPKEMSNEENYCFGVAGYLHVPGVLNRREVEALNRALDEMDEGESMLGSSHRELFRDLLVNPQLVWYLDQIIGYGFRLDQAPELLGAGASAARKPLAGGNEPRDPVRAYYHQSNNIYYHHFRNHPLFGRLSGRRPGTINRIEPV